MTKTIPRQIMCAMTLAGLLMTLSVATAAAQGPPDPPRGPASARLDELEAKLDTLINEVRQLRRDIQRQRASMQLGPRGSQFGPWSPPYAQPHHAQRGNFHPGGWQAPWGPRFQGPPAGFGPPPWAGRRGGPPSMRDRALQGAPDEKADQTLDGPRAGRKPWPGDEDADAPRDRGPGDRGERGPDRPRNRDADGPRDREDRKPEGDRDREPDVLQ